MFNAPKKKSRSRLSYLELTNSPQQENQAPPAPTPMEIVSENAWVYKTPTKQMREVPFSLIGNCRTPMNIDTALQSPTKQPLSTPERRKKLNVELFADGSDTNLSDSSPSDSDLSGSIDSTQFSASSEYCPLETLKQSFEVLFTQPETIDTLIQHINHMTFAQPETFADPTFNTYLQTIKPQLLNLEAKQLIALCEAFIEVESLAPYQTFLDVGLHRTLKLTQTIKQLEYLLKNQETFTSSARNLVVGSYSPPTLYRTNLPEKQPKSRRVQSNLKLRRLRSISVRAEKELKELSKYFSKRPGTLDIAAIYVCQMLGDNSTISSDVHVSMCMNMLHHFDARRMSECISGFLQALKERLSVSHHHVCDTKFLSKHHAIRLFSTLLLKGYVDLDHSAPVIQHIGVLDLLYIITLLPDTQAAKWEHPLSEALYQRVKRLLTNYKDFGSLPFTLRHNLEFGLDALPYYLSLEAPQIYELLELAQTISNETLIDKTLNLITPDQWTAACSDLETDPEANYIPTLFFTAKLQRYAQLPEKDVQELVANEAIFETNVEHIVDKLVIILSNKLFDYNDQPLDEITFSKLFKPFLALKNVSQNTADQVVKTLQDKIIENNFNGNIKAEDPTSKNNLLLDAINHCFEQGYTGMDQHRDWRFEHHINASSPNKRRCLRV